MAKKGEKVDRTQYHDWKPYSEDENKVVCEKCGVVVHTNVARRGIGPCKGTLDALERGEVEEHEPEPEDIRMNLPVMKPFTPSGEDHGTCNGCGEPIKEMPFNSRLAMVACANPRCNFYRQRLRFIDIK